MPLGIIRIQDRIKLTNKEVERIVREHIISETGRNVVNIEFHIGRDDLGGATIYLAHMGES